MAADYYIMLKNQAGAQVALFDKWYRLEYHRQRNETGWCRLDLHLPDGRSTLFNLDSQIEIYRRGDWAGASWYVDMEALHRREDYTMLATGQERFKSWGPGYLELLRRRIGLYWLYNHDAFTRDGYLTITATAPEVIGEFVDREAGPAAEVARRTAGLTLAAIAPAGVTITEQLRNTELLLRCQQLAEGYGLDMRIVGNGVAQFEFQVAPVLGTDRRVGNPFANPPMVFRPDYGNMAKPRYLEDRLDEGNHVFVGGQGTGWERMIYDQQDAGLVADSPWNLREFFVDARDIAREDEMPARAVQALEENEPIADLEFTVVETDAYKYGRDWDLYDLVTGIYRGQQDYRVEAVTVTVTDAGVETIKADLIAY